MSNADEPKLSPEAIKMLNEMAAKRSHDVDLTPEAKANLDKLANFHLIHTYRAHKNSYLAVAIVMAMLSAGAVMFGLESIIRDPEHAVKYSSGLTLMAVIPVALAYGAFHFWRLHKKL